MPASKRTRPKAAPAKSRSVVPIQDTIESIRGFPDKLVIFKVPASPFWWVRYYDSKPIKRSTKTENRQEAIRFAKKFYETVLVNNALGHSNNPKVKSFMQCAEGLIKEDHEKAARGEIKEKYAYTQKQTINNHIRTFFKHVEIGDVDYTLLDEFKTYLFEEDLAASSVKIHFVSISKIFGYAQRHNIVKTAPLMPKVKLEDNPRGYLKVHEYVKLRRVTRRLIGYVGKIKQKEQYEDGEKLKVLRNVVVTRELQLMIGFMIYTFVRTGDIKQMKHKHIEIRKGDDGEYLWMPLPKSKRHISPITSMPRAAYFYKRLRDDAIAEKARATGLPKDKVDISDDYVFMPQHKNRSYAYQQIYRQFELVLETANLKTNYKGDKIAPYSLRHTSIMYRLIYGGEINTTKIAKNARTSTEVIERFYVAQLESSDVTRDLHKRKEPRSKRKTTTFISHDNTPSLDDLMKRDKDKFPEHVRNTPLKLG